MSLEKTIAGMFGKSNWDKLAEETRQEYDGANDAIPRPNDATPPDTATELKRNRMAQIKTKIIDEEAVDEVVVAGEKGPKGVPFKKTFKSMKDASDWMDSPEFAQGDQLHSINKFEETETEEVDEGVRDLRKGAIRARNDKMRSIDGARRLSKKGYTPPGTPTKDEKRKENAVALKAFLAKGGKIRKEDLEMDAETIEEKKHMSKADIAALEEPKDKIDGKDLAALRAKKHLRKEEGIDEKASYCKACGKTHEMGKCSMSEGAMPEDEKNMTPQINRNVANEKGRLMGGKGPEANMAGRGLPTGKVVRSDTTAKITAPDPRNNMKGRGLPNNVVRTEEVVNEADLSISKIEPSITATGVGKSSTLDPAKLKRKGYMPGVMGGMAAALGLPVGTGVAAALKSEETILEAGEYVTMRKVNKTRTVRNLPNLIAKYKAEGWVIVAEGYEDYSIDELIEMKLFLEDVAVKRGRGRPRKNPEAAAAPAGPKRGRGRPKKVADASTAQGQEDIKNPNTLHLNLKKAADFNDVTHTFANGQQAKISRGHAVAILNRHTVAKGADAKDAILKQAHASPEGFKAMAAGASAPVPSGKKEIKLGGSDRLRALLAKKD